MKRLNSIFPILAVVFLLSAVGCQSESEAERYFDQAEELYEAGLYYEAIEEYTKAIQLDGTYVKAYHNRGIAYVMPGQYQRAIEDFDRVIQLDPDYALAYVWRGIAYRDLGQLQRAIEDFDKACLRDSEYCRGGEAAK